MILKTATWLVNPVYIDLVEFQVKMNKMRRWKSWRILFFPLMSPPMGRLRQTDTDMSYLENVERLHFT